MNDKPSWTTPLLAGGEWSSVALAAMAELRGDRGWDAALEVLCFPRFAGDADVWRHVDLERRAIHFRPMFRRTGYMSTGEQLLLRVAASSFNPAYRIGLWDLVRLDASFRACARRAIDCVIR